ncbi:MAG: hypothetical protein Q8Q39_00630 [bacterium]|nr:hypothetical protein [bacterium]
MQGEIFKKNVAGRIVEMETIVTLFPSNENSFKILFGGKVLEAMDELSGHLATLFIGTKHLQAMHVNENVFFEKPIESGEIGKVQARVMFSTDKIIAVYIAVYGGSMQEPDDFSLRYEGFGFCAMFDTREAVRHVQRNLTPYENTDHPELVAAARFAFNAQCALIKMLKATHATNTGS